MAKKSDDKLTVVYGCGYENCTCHKRHGGYIGAVCCDWCRTKEYRKIMPEDPTKATNPKDMIGSGKVPVHLWPPIATIYGSLGCLDGCLKYGRTNWRKAGIRYTIYLDAIMRHTMALLEGEDLDPDSGLPHISHILASAAIIADAKEAGMLNDDRNVRGGYRQGIDRLTDEVARLKEKHADKNPKHWTINDNE